MSKDVLIERIMYLINNLEGGNLAAFARNISISRTTLRRNIVKNKVYLIKRHEDEILNAYPKVRREWLAFGKGEPFYDSKDLPASQTVTNVHGQYIGDSLNDAIFSGYLRFEDICQQTGFSQEHLKNLLDSHYFPTFKDLQALFIEFGLRTNVLFEKKFGDIFEPKTEFERFLKATGLKKEDVYQIAKIIGADKDEIRGHIKTVKRSLKKWAERKKPTDFDFDENEPDDFYFPRLPSGWSENIEKNIGLSSDWLSSGSGPMISNKLVRKTYYGKQENLEDKENIANLKKELEIREEMLALYRKLLAEKEEKLKKIDEVNPNEVAKNAAIFTVPEP